VVPARIHGEAAVVIAADIDELMVPVNKELLKAQRDRIGAKRRGIKSNEDCNKPSHLRIDAEWRIF